MNDLLDPKTFAKQIHLALRRWNDVQNPTLEQFYGLWLTRLEQEAAALNGQEMLRATAAKQVLKTGLAKLAEQDLSDKDLLTWRFIEEQPIKLIAKRLKQGEEQIVYSQQKAIKKLASTILEWEQGSRQLHQQTILQKLPTPTYQQFVGFTTDHQQLVGQLLAESGAWVVLIAGIGGIGKTALADKVTRLISPHLHFSHIAYVRVEHSLLQADANQPQHLLEQIIDKLCPQLPHFSPHWAPSQRQVEVRRQLKTVPHLVFLDNLEDAASLSYLLPQLLDWTQPSKFIVTTREHQISHQGVYLYLLGELPQADAFDLIRLRAEECQLFDLAQAPDDCLAPIYDCVGGNPLALRLFVGLVVNTPLSAVLAEFQRGSSQSTQDLFWSIYHKAFDTLSPVAKTVFKCMPFMLEDGGTPQDIQESIGLTEQQVRTALQDLAVRSLVEVRGDAWNKRYGIHRLTETFLKTEIIRW